MASELNVGKIEKIKSDILGSEYSLSVAYVSEKKSEEINKKYRNKDKPTNVLSFPLRENEGELLLCKPVIEREAKDFNKTFDEFMLLLVIHGMLHLKGHEHSSTMEKAEELYYQKYDQKYFSRDRRGLIGDESRRGRVRKGRKKS